jgi:SAM-dependent methyltransferase
MKEDAARFWDERHRDQEAAPERGPALFLVENVGLLPGKGSARSAQTGRPGSGQALDVAMGRGRNALYLASLRYDVTGIDISPVGVERCRREAERLGYRLDAVCADLESYKIPRDAFDVVVNFYYLQRDLSPRMVDALKPGGVLVFETFTTEQRRFGWGPRNEEFLLRPGELRELFRDLEVLVYREETRVREGERGEKAVASLVGRKAIR